MALSLGIACGYPQGGYRAPQGQYGAPQQPQGQYGAPAAPKCQTRRVPEPTSYKCQQDQECQTRYEQECNTSYEEECQTKYEEQCELEYQEKCETKYEVRQTQLDTRQVSSMMHPAKPTVSSVVSIVFPGICFVLLDFEK